MAYEPYIDYGLAVARGLDKTKAMFKYGRQTSLSTANTTVWDKNSLYSFLTSSTVLKLASDSASDATAGTGATEVTIYGLDNDYKEISEAIAISGVTAKTTTNDYLRVYRMVVTASGSGATNAGKISIIPNAAAGSTFTAGTGVPTTTSNVQAQIMTATSQSLMGIYTVPATFTMYMTEMHAACAQDKNVTVELFARPYGEAFQIKTTTELHRSIADKSFNPPIKFLPKTDIEFRARASSATGNVSVEFNSILCQGD